MPISTARSARPSRTVRAGLLGLLLAAEGLAPTGAVAEDTPQENDDLRRAEPIRLGGELIEPGDKRRMRLAASESFSGADVSIPLVVVRGRTQGPTLCLVAGIHGDELNGVEVVRRVADRLDPELISGTVLAVPIVNLFGFWNQSRYLPDRRDLNRHFPGREMGSAASRLAHRFWTEVVRHCTHLVDFHTGTLHRSNLPQVRGDLSDPQVAALAHAFGSGVIVHNRGLPSTLRAQAVRAGIPAILYEAGENFRFQRKQIEAGVDGTWRVMSYLGMLPGSQPIPKTKMFLETHWIRARSGGIAELYPRLGATVAKGEIVGRVSDPLGHSVVEIRSPFSGIVLGRLVAPTVVPGLALIHVGIEKGSMRATEAGAEEVDEERPE